MKSQTSKFPTFSKFSTLLAASLLAAFLLLTGCSSKSDVKDRLKVRRRMPNWQGRSNRGSIVIPC
jgi:hypothetical protein